jgi:hypothetical protein
MAFLACWNKRIRVIAAAAILLLPLPRAVFAADSALQLNEQTIKAGLVYNFLKYTTWPPDSSPHRKGSLIVCLFGAAPSNSYLQPLQGQTAQQAVISLVRKSGAGDMKECSVIFVDSDGEAQLPALLASIKGEHILTASDIDGFARMGGMVELTMVDKRVALFVNNKAVEAAGLSIQGRLLNLAKKVE